MIFRLSQKLKAKIKAGNLSEMPRDENPFADWSCHLFVADRKQYILLTNTLSLYSTVMYAKGITSQRQFIEAAVGSICKFLEADGLATVCQKHLVPAAEKVQLAKPLSRSVIRSMNDLILHAGDWLIEDGLPVHEVSFKLNAIPFSPLKYGRPRDAFRALLVAQPTKESNEE